MHHQITFTIIALNVNSICAMKRKLLLNNFIQNNPADVFLISETRLANGSNFRHNGYKFVNNKNNKNSGGTAILINNNIKTKNVTTKNLSDIEFTAIDTLINKQWCRIISVYVHCQSLDHNSMLESNFTTNLPTIIGGDFNARNSEWNDCVSNRNGNILQNLFIYSNFDISPTKFPTCFRAEEGSYIDFFIHRNAENFELSKVSNLASFSDHNAIKISINNATSNTITIPKRKVFNFTRIKPLNRFVENKFNELNLPTNNNISNNEIDQCADSIERIFRESVEKYVPTTEDGPFKIRFSKNTKLLLAQSKRLQRRIHRNLLLNISENRSIHNELRLIQTALKNSVSFDIKNFYANKIADTEYHKNIHDTVKTCSSYGKKIRYVNNLEDTEGNQLADGDIPELFAQHFAKNHELTHNCTSDIEEMVAETLENSLANTNDNIVFNGLISANIPNKKELNEFESKMPERFHNRLTNTKEIIDVVQKRKIKKKSSGSDAFPIYLIQFLTLGIMTKLTILFNHCIANGHFPLVWKFALIISIPKANKNAKVITNYRPISQLSSISKVFEKILLIRMKKISDMTTFSNQFGFKNNCGTIQPLSIIHNTIAEGLNAGKFTTLVSLDIQSAFDSVWTRGLLYKLSNQGFDSFWIKIINSFLTNRSFAVKIGSSISASHDIVAGTPQGAILSPYLFNHFVSDIPTDSFIKTSQYADDTAIFATHKNTIKIQNAINAHLSRLSV